MMLAEFEYTAPRNLREAVAALKTNVGSRPLAGGQGLVPSMASRREGPALVVDLRRIEELRGVSRIGGAVGAGVDREAAVRVGALTTLAELVEPSLPFVPPAALLDAVRSTGDPQLRNRATIGGSVACRHRASDIAAVLVMLGAAVTVAGAAGQRVVAVEEFLGAGGPAFTSDEVVVAVELPEARAGVGTAYERVHDRATLQPVCGVAVSVTTTAKGAIDTARVVVIGVTNAPTRLADAERSLVGRTPPVDTSELPLDVGVFGDPLDARDVDLLNLDPWSDSAYRVELTRVLIGRAVERAILDGA
jgi:carbon-monoxide dehydrogenase medium subunit